MVHIFAGEGQHVTHIQRLSVVLTLATLAFYQQGDVEKQKQKKKLLRHVEMLFVALKVLTSAAGVQDHPDIAESFMHLHAQVNHTAITYVYHVYTTPPY